MGSVDRTRAAWAVRGAGRDEAFERYRQGMGGLYAIEGVTPRARRRFYNRSGMTLGAMGLVGWGESPPQTMIRNRDLTRRSEIDGLNLVVNMAPVLGDSDGRPLRARAGDVQFRDLSRPSAGRYRRVCLTTLMVPRDRMPPALLAADLHGRVLPVASEAGRVLSGHIRLLSRLSSVLSPDQLETGVRAALIMAGRAMGDARALAPEDETALRQSLRWRAARAIERRLLDPDLGPDQVARVCGGSRASLYRAFEAEGGIGRYIQSRRLERAYRHLLSDHEPRRIGEVALVHGFASQPHFSRLFRGRFGCAPSSVGPDGGVAPPEGAVAAPYGAMRHGEAVAWLRALSAGA